MSDVAVPKFCSEGCGETLVAELLTGEYLKIIQKANPDFKNHWKYVCKNCGKGGVVSEGKIDSNL